MNRGITFILLCVLLCVGRLCHGMAEEQIGPDSDHPTSAQPGWPHGIVGIPRHLSRVYSIWVNGNENFYFKCEIDEINELLSTFAKTRMRDHIVQIRPGAAKTTTFRKQEIDYNVSLQIVAGIALHFAREEAKNDLPLEPRLTILTGNDPTLVNRLTWPENVIVESEIPGVVINLHNATPKRHTYHGLCELADGSPPVEFVKIRSEITFWEQAEPNGINVGSVDNKGYFMVLLSDTELANLKLGKTWLTLTMGNFLVKPQKTDMRFPIDMLTPDKDEAQAIKVAGPEYYYGRILFEDGSPPILDPRPWPGARISVDFPYAGRGDFDAQGYFKLTMTPAQFEQLCARKPRRNIYIPDLIKRGRSSAVFTFPANLLRRDKAKAGVVEIPCPKLPRKELSDAKSKLEETIPGLYNVRFDGFNTERTREKPLLICFWDMDQRPSRQCIQTLQNKKGLWQNKDRVVIAIHAGVKQEKQVRQWLTKQGISVPVGTVEGDPYDTLFAWGARSMPWLLLTDEEHIIIREGFSLNDLSDVN
ncbi:MAG: hypothetical protein GY809_20015 [Planctomycetes bacterium]|nr:hypothetical protein [Planctomycetota bacterium]